VVDDGTLTEKDKFALHHLFEVTIVAKSESARKMKRFLSKSKYPDFYEYRFTQRDTFSKVKLDSLFLCPFDRIICMDSDVLFFSRPHRILDWLDKGSSKVLYNFHSWKNVDASQMPDMEHAFRELLRRYLHGKFTFHSTFNAGLFCLPNKGVLDLRMMNQLFKLFDEVTYSRFSIVDETLLGCLFANTKVGTKLPADECVVAPFMMDYPREKSESLQAIHYASESKVVFPFDAVSLVRRTQFFHKLL